MKESVGIATATIAPRRDAMVTPPRIAVRRGPRVVCLNCNVQNELQPGLAVCARCGEPLLDSRIVDMTPRRLSQHLKGNDYPVAILYWSASRYETYALNDDFSEAADYLHSTVRFGRVDVDAFPDLAQKMFATHAPQLVLYRFGIEVARWNTPMFMPEMVAWIRANASGMTETAK